MREILVAVGAVWIASCAPPPTRNLAGPMQPLGAPARPALALTAKDALGEPFHLGPPEQREVAVVFLMSRDTKDESAELARGVDEKLLALPIDQVAIVDLHKLAGILRPAAERQLRKSAAEGRIHRRERRELGHADASAQAIDRWHLVGDFDGSLFGRFGVEPELRQPTAFVVERSGQVHGPYRTVTGVVDEVARLAGGAAGGGPHTAAR